MSIDERAIESKVVDYYINSKDYKGLPVSHLAKNQGITVSDALEVAKKLVRSGRLSIPSPYQTNPFIMAFDYPIAEQLLGLNERNPGLICLYPTSAAVAEVIDSRSYDDRPFTKLMALASPKLVAIPFRLDVLDYYDHDPRYEVIIYGFGGRIQVPDEYYDQLEPADRMNLRFGIGYDDDGDRVVAVYTFEMARLPGKQQRIWKEFVLNRNCQMSEEFFTTSILGEPAKAISVYSAIISEQVEINKILIMMGRSPLFRQTFDDSQRPRQFSVFVKPTQRNYNDFVHLMDKMLSENLDTKAFGSEVHRQEREQASDGTIVSRPKGSIALLEEWLSVRFPEMASVERGIITEPLKEVRQIRQRPAHKIVQDKYDEAFYGLQVKLVWKVYDALHSLRRLLATDSSATGYKPPYWDGKFTIKSF